MTVVASPTLAGRTPSLAEKNLGGRSESGASGTPFGKESCCWDQFCPPSRVTKSQAMLTESLPVIQPIVALLKTIPVFVPPNGSFPGGGLSVEAGSTLVTSAQVLPPSVVRTTT